MYLEDLSFSRRELSNGGLKIVVALLLCWQIVFCHLILGVQSSCTYFKFETVLPSRPLSSPTLNAR